MEFVAGRERDADPHEGTAVGAEVDDYARRKVSVNERSRRSGVEPPAARVITTHGERTLRPPR
jgi:hypothetical protein